MDQIIEVIKNNIVSIILSGFSFIASIITIFVEVSKVKMNNTNTIKVIKEENEANLRTIKQQFENDMKKKEADFTHEVELLKTSANTDMAKMITEEIAKTTIQNVMQAPETKELLSASLVNAFYKSAGNNKT